MPSANEQRLLVGVDLVRISDVTQSIERFGERYLGRLFTAGERSYCQAEPARSAERFAARVAAKEAAIKVLRPGPDDAIAPASVEVFRSQEGWCELRLHGDAEQLARRNGVRDLAVSLSHEHEYAMATVVAHRGH